MLSALIIIPLIGAIFIAFFPGKKTSSFYRFLALIYNYLNINLIESIKLIRQFNLQLIMHLYLQFHI